MWVSYCAKSCGFCYGISIILEIFEIFYNEIFYCTNILSHQTLLQYIFHINYCNNSNVIVMIFFFFFLVTINNFSYTLRLFSWKKIFREYFLVFGSIRKYELKENYLI